MVFSELVMDCLLAGAPTNRYPDLVKATMEGVVLLPSELGMTLGVLASMRATQELVVPKSIPMIVDDVLRREKRLYIFVSMYLMMENYWMVIIILGIIMILMIVVEDVIRYVLFVEDKILMLSNIIYETYMLLYKFKLNE
jgi:hypothetical protein